MDKAEILKLLEEWQAVGIEGMNYRFAKWFRSGFDGNTLLESPRTQKHFDLLRRTKKALKEGAGKMNKIEEKEAMEQRRKFNDMQLQEFALAFMEGGTAREEYGSTTPHR